MKNRLTALLLALGLTVSLAACAPKDQGPEPSDVLEPTPGVSAEITDLPTQSDTPAEPTASESVEPQETPSTEPTVAPTESAIGDPTAPPTTEPTEEPQPSDTPSIAVLAASEVYAAVAKAAGETTATMDASAVLENFYNLSASDLEDFAFYIPELSANMEEIFIARVKEGKLDSVKAACQSRLDGMKEDGAFYPATALYLDGAQIVTEGDWVMLCVCPDSAGAVKAFRDAVK